MIDYWKLTKDFAPGDYVQKYISSRSVSLSPYVGRVTAVLHGIGFLDVQWPFDNERVSPEEVVKVNKEFASFLPPSLNFSYYPGLEQLREASTSSWRSTELPPGFHKELAKLFHKGAHEVQAYDELWHRFASFSDDAALRDEVDKFYRFASNSIDLFLQEFIRKSATYWVGQNRTHRATKTEVSNRCPNCPRCGTAMRKATYKMAEGQRERLFACPKDLYLIKQADILGPGGEPITW
jgi:hypothetical protein